MRASRHALFRSIFESLPDVPVARIIEVIVNLLEGSYMDDRQAIPLLETTALIMEQATGIAEETLPTRQIWNIVRKAHFKSTNIRKLEAAVRIYAALAVQGDMRKNGQGKLRDLLLHPYPRVSCPHRWSSINQRSESRILMRVYEC